MLRSIFAFDCGRTEENVANNFIPSLSLFLISHGMPITTYYLAPEECVTPKELSRLPLEGLLDEWVEVIRTSMCRK